MTQAAPARRDLDSVVRSERRKGSLSLPVHRLPTEKFVLLISFSRPDLAFRCRRRLLYVAPDHSFSGLRRRLLLWMRTIRGGLRKTPAAGLKIQMKPVQ